ncbi:MAG: ATP-binding protein [Myxococcota bacterium]
MTKPTADKLGELLGMVVHDLRNPTATVGANVSYVKDVVGDRDDDLREALEDVEIALSDLMRGLEQLSWIGRWLGDKPATQSSDGDVAVTLRSLKAPSAEIDLVVEAPEESLRAKGGGVGLGKLLMVLLANSVQHARGGKVTVNGRRAGDQIVIDIVDGGAAVAESLREDAFTLEGQDKLKGRADGRYSRVAGLFSARLVADAIGATVEAGGSDGAALFRVSLPAS